MPDYAALAKQAGAIESKPAAGVDYTALAKQAGAIQSQPAAAAPSGGVLDSVGRFIKGVGQELNPLTMLQGLADMTAHPIDTGRAMLQAQADTIGRAWDSFSNGNAVEGVRRSINAAIPVAGPQMDDMGDQAQGGDVAGALGRATGFGLANALPDAPIVRTGLRNATFSRWRRRWTSR